MKSLRQALNCFLFSNVLLFSSWKVCGEQHRFETLMDYFKNYDEFHIDFMVSILLHSSYFPLHIFKHKVNVIDFNCCVIFDIIYVQRCHSFRLMRNQYLVDELGSLEMVTGLVKGLRGKHGNCVFSFFLIVYVCGCACGCVVLACMNKPVSK